jgi:hypothetical protein
MDSQPHICRDPRDQTGAHLSTQISPAAASIQNVKSMYVHNICLFSLVRVGQSIVVLDIIGKVAANKALFFFFLAIRVMQRLAV